MKSFRIVMATVLLICALPLVSVLLAGGIAGMLGCVVHEGYANPCMIAGRDIGGALTAMVVMGWLMLATMPLASIALPAWIIVELVQFWRRRQSRGG